MTRATHIETNDVKQKQKYIMNARKRRIKHQGDTTDTKCCICLKNSKLCKLGKKKCVCTTTLHLPNNKKVCQHTFCFKCINQWSKESNTCPLCRKRFYKLICNKREAYITTSNRLVRRLVEALIMSTEFRLKLVMDVLHNDPGGILAWEAVNRYTVSMERNFGVENVRHLFVGFYNMVLTLREIHSFN